MRLSAFAFTLAACGAARPPPPTPTLAAHEEHDAPCGRLQPVGCFALAVKHRDGIGVPRSRGRATELFSVGCREGDPKCCVALGDLRRETAASRDEWENVAVAYAAGCEFGVVDACPKRDDARTRRLALARRLCEDGPSSCGPYVDALRADGRKDAADAVIRSSVAALDAECDRQATSCERAGRVAARLRGERWDAVLPWAARGCIGGDANACAELPSWGREKACDAVKNGCARRSAPACDDVVDRACAK